MGRRARTALMLAPVMALGLAGAASAKNFGSYGTLFPVAEPDFLEEILSRFRAMEKDGGLAQMERDMQQRTRDYLARPTAGAILPPATDYRAFEFDPSITLDRDLSDHEGRVFATAGTRINPLDYSGFAKRIVVIDGDAPGQVAFALSEGDELDTLIVIAKGAPLDLSRTHGRRFWFDQQGVIVRRFGVERLPTLITRADPVLLIEEIPVKEEDQP
ncbi:hypothetical protein FAZ78_00815 [Cereibacter changlensis]|uniref:Type-F conjugative transfer system protein TraW N-terminal domain-containing protein n=2 Tax=Cereibacter changlensis TaxID=402884 RepID=A0A4U0Z9X3_9RHOB|nr:hypothetical protein FAZ78_00815 [Cereibacter changlensis]